jgi:hypothetical protein
MFRETLRSTKCLAAFDSQIPLWLTGEREKCVRNVSEIAQRCYDYVRVYNRLCGETGH